MPALTVNKVCLSGLNAIALADLMIRSGECQVVVAGGMESMSRAPHLLPTSRTGFKFGSVTLLDHMAHDGLWDPFTDQAMGALTESCNTGAALVSRADQDAFAARSHQRRWPRESGLLAEEIVPIEVPQRGGAPVTVAADEGIRDGVTAEALAALRPAFGADGTITAAVPARSPTARPR